MAITFNLPLVLLIAGVIVSIVMMRFAFKFMWIAVPIIVVAAILYFR